MAIKTIQLLRSETVYASHKAALDALVEQLTSTNAKDGQPILARYKVGETGTEHTLLGIKGKTGYEIFDNEGTQSAAVTSVQYDGETKKITYTKNGSPTDVVTLAAVATTGAATDVTFGETNVATELTSIKDKIAAMDKAASAENGKVVTTVSEADGVVSETKANVKDLQLGGYEKDTSATGAIGGTDTINTALSKLENTVATNAIVSDDGSIKVGPSATAGTSVVVNVDGTTIVKSTGGALKADLTVAKLTDAEVTALSDANVKEAYKLICKTDADRTAIGDVVKIYKDSSLYSVYLGHVDDTITSSTNPTTVSGTGDAALCFIYQKADGTYELVAVNVESFLEESEFKNGLQVVNHEVSVKVDDTGEFLSVSADGVKVSGVSDAIKAAIAGLDATPSQAAGADGLALSLTEVDGVVTAISGSIAANTYDAYGAASAAVEALDATVSQPAGADGLALSVTETDGVITAISGSIAAETYDTYGAASAAEARAKAYTDAEIAGLDSTVSATAASDDVYSVLTGVTQTDGKLTGKTEVTLAAAAKTGAAADVSIADTGEYFTATNVEAALAELATFDCGSY